MKLLKSKQFLCLALPSHCVWTHPPSSGSFLWLHFLFIPFVSSFQRSEMMKHGVFLCLSLVIVTVISTPVIDEDEDYQLVICILDIWKPGALTRSRGLGQLMIQSWYIRSIRNNEFWTRKWLIYPVEVEFWQL